ncbi:MAG: hypothetical protein IIW86_00020 [Clostridia bacterium]|nr:hypothetical protein [Clostridia bacterium]
MNKRFLFFENFKSIADKLPDDMRLEFYDALLAYVFDGVEPDDAVVAALITAIKPSLDKEDKRGGLRDGAGAPKGNQNATKTIKNNQKQSKNILDNQNNQSFLETETGNRKEEIKENNTLTGITKEKNKIFQKPTIEEVQSYCQERNNGVDAQKFFDYYTANGWKVGKNSMKDWRAAVRTWERSTVAPTASRKSADDDAEYWEDLARRLKIQEGAAQ